MSIRGSLLAIGAALAAVLAVQVALVGALRLAAPTLEGMHLAGPARSAALVTAYLLGTVSAAAAAGVALGRLAPTKPSLHVGAVALLSPLIGFLLVGSSALPRGWQVVGYGLQLVLIEAISLAVFRRRPPTPARLSTRPT